jgi:hypothetical protein
MTTEKRTLMAALTEVEIDERVLQLDSTLEKLDEKRAEAKTKLGTMKAELRELERESELLQRAIRSGYDLKEIDCDVVEVTAKSVTRKDTGAFIEYLPLEAEPIKELVVKKTK